ncbi:DUF5665 domain-containing protein [Irregularibacter muris]|uniref:DUF5665 domain-containing protein n=1 Tax=Irregularibacter muris TaxID=1796619 RepID=A0AAE3L2A3_9FIRM|nr:DUF5665 domain-containing protein [Irregularibacter muris]MCR1898184.1 DUF5665 domain-containing protein [Irregularibacter muris]
MQDPQELLEKINDKMENISVQLEKSKIEDYVDFMHNWKKLLINNFLGGLARGVGMAIGFSVLGALIIYLLRYLVLLNLPIIGRFISEVVRIVQNNI